MRTGGPTAVGGAPAATAEAPERRALLTLAASPKGAVGAVVTVTLANRSDAVIEGELLYDVTQLQSAQAAAPAPGGAPGSATDAGHVAFRLEAGSDQVVPLRVLPAAAGQRVSVALGGISATNLRGEAVPVSVDGEAAITVDRP
jgi:hypothetical protein